MAVVTFASSGEHMASPGGTRPWTVSRPAAMYSLKRVTKPQWSFHLRLPRRPLSSSWYDRWKLSRENAGSERCQCPPDPHDSIYPHCRLTYAPQESSGTALEVRNTLPCEEQQDQQCPPSAETRVDERSGGSNKNSMSEFAALFAEAQSDPINSQANAVAVILSLATAAFLLWNRYEATSVLCILVYLVWGFRALITTVYDALFVPQPPKQKLQKLRKAGMIAAVIFVCLILSLGLGWANSPALRMARQRMLMGQFSSIMYTLALCSMEFCALAKIAQYLLGVCRSWRHRLQETFQKSHQPVQGPPPHVPHVTNNSQHKSHIQEAQLHPC